MRGHDGHPDKKKSSRQEGERDHGGDVAVQRDRGPGREIDGGELERCVVQHDIDDRPG